MQLPTSGRGRLTAPCAAGTGGHDEEDLTSEYGVINSSVSTNSINVHDYLIGARCRCSDPTVQRQQVLAPHQENVRRSCHVELQVWPCPHSRPSNLELEDLEVPQAAP